VRVLVLRLAAMLEACRALHTGALKARAFSGSAFVVPEGDPVAVRDESGNAVGIAGGSDFRRPVRLT
jgi:hypothetical protein